MSKHEVIVESTGEIVTLSDEAAALMAKPVPIMPFVEDVYSVTTSEPEQGKRWYVVFVRPTHDAPERVERYGKRFGFRSYWPKRVRMVKRGKGQKQRLVPAAAPLMNRYVLMQMPEREPPFGILTGHEGKFNGVCGFLGNSYGPIHVPADLVERLQAREREGEFDETVKRGRRAFAKLPHWAAPGEIVKVSSGPFSGLQGIVESHTAAGRLEVGIILFGQSNSVDMGLEQIAAFGY